MADHQEVSLSWCLCLSSLPLSVSLLSSVLKVHQLPEEQQDHHVSNAGRGQPGGLGESQDL